MDVAGSVELCWNDSATVLAGGHWSVLRHDTGERRRAALHAIVGLVDEDAAVRCLAVHVRFLAELVEAAERLHDHIAEGFSDSSLSVAHGRIRPDSPIGCSCRQAAAAIDVCVYDLSMALGKLGRKPDADTGGLVLAATHSSLFMRSLIGLHRSPAAALADPF